jgi:hypothetical protein
MEKKLYRSIGRSQSGRYHCKQRKKQHWNRNTKDGIPRSMSRKRIGKFENFKGYSFNPLYSFLNKNKNHKWGAVYSEACGKLEPWMRKEIFRIVDLEHKSRSGRAHLGGKYFLSMYVDSEGVLRTYL